MSECSLIDNGGVTRARPLPPDERRAAIVTAAHPLFIEQGDGYTTRQVARAAGIAEGTIFRVFPTKDDLTRAVLDQALDTAPTCARLAAIPSDLPLDDIVTRTLGVLLTSVRDSTEVFTALHRRRSSSDAPGTSNATPARDAGPSHDADDPHDRAHDRARARTRQLHEAVLAVLAPHADQLRIPVDQAASLLRQVAFANAHPHFTEHAITDPATLATVLLHGITRDQTARN